jgi:hypothetical protein
LPNEDQSLMKRLLPLTTVLMLVAVLYAGWIVYSRWSEGRDDPAARHEKEVADAKKVVEAYGGERVKIHSFSADAGSLVKGQSTQLCYGVANAKTVNIDPKPAEETWPSMSRCVKVQPEQDTTYTLSAKDAQGNEEKAQLTVEVHRLQVKSH